MAGCNCGGSGGSGRAFEPNRQQALAAQKRAQPVGTVRSKEGPGTPGYGSRSTRTPRP